MFWKPLQQRKAESQGVTEDDVNEIKQDISAFRCEIVEILKGKGMNTSNVSGQGAGKHTRTTHNILTYTCRKHKHDAFSKMDVLLCILHMRMLVLLCWNMGEMRLLNTHGEHQICVPFALAW